MVALAQPRSTAEPQSRGWRSPARWLEAQDLGRGYWVFFSSAFFFDAGFATYFFLFNLYLLDYHFNERSIGLIGGALTFGTLLGTLPAGVLAQRLGLRSLLFFCFISAPLLNALRALWIWEPAQIAIAFLAGLAMCIWGVCYLPAIARLTGEKNRTAAYSLTFASSIGTSVLGGIVCGYLPRWLAAAGFTLPPARVKLLILLAACGIALAALLPLAFLRIPSRRAEGDVETGSARRWAGLLQIHPFLRRYLPLMAVWSAVLAAFTPFANVYLQRELHIPLSRIGLIFSVTQIVQLGMGLLTPLIVRATSLMHSIVGMQIAAAVSLGCMAVAWSSTLAIALYLAFAAAQWMCTPGLYNLLMNETPDEQRSAAAAMTLFCNALAGSIATAGTGALITRLGYKPVLLGIAAIALVTALLFHLLIVPQQRNPGEKRPSLCAGEGQG